MMSFRQILILNILMVSSFVMADEFVTDSPDEEGAEIIDMRGTIVPSEVQVEPFPTPFKERPPVMQIAPPEDKAEPAETESEPEPPPPPSPIHEDLQIFLDGNYVKTHCESIERCDEMIRLDCDYKQEGPIYYFDNVEGKTLMTCGSACLEPDPYDPLGCKECPPKGWKECMSREEQKRLAEEAAQRKAEEEAYQQLLEQEREIEKKMLEAEKDYMRRLHELEDAMRQLYDKEQAE